MRVFHVSIKYDFVGYVKKRYSLMIITKQLSSFLYKGKMIPGFHSSSPGILYYFYPFLN